MGLGRTSKISSVVAAICITIYIIAISSAAVQIIDSTGERRNRAEREFYDLADRASSSAVFLGFMSPAYQETIRDYLGASETLLGIIITGSDGEYTFERFPGSGIIWTGQSPRFKTGGGFPSEPFFLPLRIDGQRNVTIQAIYSYIDYDLYIKVLRNSLMAVLAALVIAFITLLVEITLKNKASLGRQTEKTERPAAPETAEEPIPETPGSETDDLFYIDDNDDTSEDTTEKDAETDTPFGDISFPEENPDDTPESPSPAEGEHPKGLFTARGNVGWESYTRDRLASELHRCASSEQDLTFLSMEFTEQEKIPDPLYRQFTDDAVTFFSMRDLIFEKGEKGISVIIPNADLEEGMVKSEEFRSQIMTELPELGSLYIGLSSRSGRLIEADRLMLESFTALEKAKDDPVSPVVAFKSDLEKYREFVKRHHKG